LVQVRVSARDADRVRLRGLGRACSEAREANGEVASYSLQ